MSLSPRQYLNAISRYTSNIHNMFVINHNKKVNSDTLENRDTSNWAALSLRLIVADASTKAATKKHLALLFFYNNEIKQAAGYLLQANHQIDREQLQCLERHMNKLERRIKRVTPDGWSDLQEIQTCPATPNYDSKVDDILTSNAFKMLSDHYIYVLNSRSSRPQFFDRPLKEKKVEIVSRLLKDIRAADSVDTIIQTLDNLYAKKSKTEDHAVLSTGRGLFTHYGPVQAKTMRFIDSLYETCQATKGSENQNAMRL